MRNTPLVRLPGLEVFFDEGRLVASGALSPLAAPILSRMNERLCTEKPAALLEDGSLVMSTWLPPIPSLAFRRLVRAEVKRQLGMHTPSTLSIEITRRCRCRCEHCEMSEGEGEMGTEDIIDVLEQALAMGTCIITLTEGDPLLREDVLDIIAAVDERAVVNMFTPGTEMTEKRAHELREAGLHTLLVSLYSTHPAAHDAVRHLDGAFDAALRAIRHGLNAGLLVALCTHVSHASMHELVPLYELARRLGVHEFSVWESTRNPPTQQDRDDIIAMYHRVNTSQEGPRMFASTVFEGVDFGCLAGRRWIHVGVDGEVRPCPYIPVSFGNVCEEPLRRIWRRMRGCSWHDGKKRCLMHEPAFLQWLQGLSMEDVPRRTR
ncbi:radical SAM/SPASM domain-containing protein [Methermicoccus shengliensis]|uniref:Radical SAM protein n=1 Tax=Methermicoccus shengliensis TaxID=660064 RepID=A0A832RX65_9EURY|nr:radical SAM protein [Methermicoccus shengliensis]KUK04356.1 MAG: Putative Fe-S oxidoreductase [Euryarchaeota archaeon 55_53]KUK30171.1 MAG: Putative Fe-S oxidoreductase [Methanosarcinales archeaon 56_1174]MDI3488669.1 hypothetical protein [Methanosarcinales archaeon]MDN5294776.1 hypothetical protein [Methanosarcinales archaeon]HIH69848.1 radical SAM protein [Methermicoccus shengliensis]